MSIRLVVQVYIYFDFRCCITTIIGTTSYYPIRIINLFCSFDLLSVLPVPNSSKVPSFKFQVSSFKFQVSSSKFQVSSSKFQVPSSKFQVPDKILESLVTGTKAVTSRYLNTTVSNSSCHQASYTNSQLRTAIHLIAYPGE
jgi:hypothetical protein